MTRLEVIERLHRTKLCLFLKHEERISLSPDNRPHSLFLLTWRMMWQLFQVASENIILLLMGFSRHTAWSRTSHSFYEKPESLVRWWWMGLVKVQVTGDQSLWRWCSGKQKAVANHIHLQTCRALTFLHFSLYQSSPSYPFLSSISFLHHFLLNGF